MVLRKEKGKLYWLGENPASDAVITRGVAGGGTQILLITRAKDGKLALVGGFIEAKRFNDKDGGELKTANAELDEETLLVDKDGNKISFVESDKTHQGRQLVKDPRNDEISYITTSVFHKHFPAEEGDQLKFRPLTEAEKLKPEFNEDTKPAWYELVSIDGNISVKSSTGEIVALKDLYASHGDILDNLIKTGQIEI